MQQNNTPYYKLLSNVKENAKDLKRCEKKNNCHFTTETFHKLFFSSASKIMNFHCFPNYGTICIKSLKCMLCHSIPHDNSNMKYLIINSTN